MSGPDIDGVPTVPTSGLGSFAGVSVGVLVGVRVGVAVDVSFGVEVGVRVGVVVGVVVGVLVGVEVGVLVGVTVGLAGAAQAGSVLVAPLHGPEELTQLEPVPQNTCPPVQAALAIVEQAPVLVLMQHPVACASTRCGENNDSETTAANANTTGPNARFPTFLDIMPPRVCRPTRTRRISRRPPACKFACPCGTWPVAVVDAFWGAAAVPWILGLLRRKDDSPGAQTEDNDHGCEA